MKDRKFPIHIEDLEKNINYWKERLKLEIEENAFIVQENEKLRKALEFYSDIENYNRHSASQINLIAREALDKK